MEDLEQSQEGMKQDITLLKDKMELIWEAIQEIAKNKTQPQAVEAPTSEPQPEVAVWPSYGLPKGYTPQELDDPTDGGMSHFRPLQASASRPKGNTAVQEDMDAAVPKPQGTMDDPILVHHSSGPQKGHDELLTRGPFPVAGEDEEAKGKIRALEERVKAMEGSSEFGLDALDMCLVSDIVLPPKFKVPTFEKYKGLTCPRNHLIMYCRKMGIAARDDKLLIFFFQESLSDASLNWYMHLDRSKIRTWRELAEAFVKQYKYNMGMAPDRMQLQDMTKKGTETFKEYAQRWRELASQVEPPLSERELVRTFIGTLSAPYYEKVIGSASSGFSDLVASGEMVEAGIKNGKILDPQNSQGAAKKFPASFPKKKEGETSAVMVDPRNSYRPPVNAHHSPALQVPYQGQHCVAAAAPAQHQQPTAQRPQYQQDSGQNQYRPPYQQRLRIDPIPMSYSELFPLLIKNSLVVPRIVKPIEPPYPYWYNPNTKCEFHGGVTGHATEDCRAFKELVQGLINSKRLSFKEKGPDVKNNPLPGHGGPGVNAIEEDNDFDEILNVQEVRTPLKEVHAKLV